MNRNEFINYLEQTLIPDLKESGHTATAEDFSVAVRFLKESPEPRPLIDAVKFDAVLMEVTGQLVRDEQYDGGHDDLPVSFDNDDLSGMEKEQAELVEAVYTAWNGPQDFSAEDGDFDEDEPAVASHVVTIRNGDSYLVQWNDNMALVGIEFLGRK